MSAKRTKLDERAWVENVIFLLTDETDGLSIDELYEMTNTRRTEAADSCLFEHPYLESGNERIWYRPPAWVKNRADLCLLLRDAYPEALRRLHLHGMYRYIAADIDDMVLKGEILCLNENTGSLVWAAHVSVATWPSDVLSIWRSLNLKKIREG